MAFADLTGFTRLGESVDASELGALAESFAELAADLAVPPVRLVKTVGDAVMLVSPDTDALISMLLDLHDATEAEDSGLPSIHAGVARGPALGTRRRRVRGGGEQGEPDRPVRPARQRPGLERGARRGRAATTPGRSPAAAGSRA